MVRLFQRFVLFIREGEKVNIKEHIDNHINIISNTFCEDFLDQIKFQGGIIASKIGQGGKVFFMGNGGSAADSQHIAAEFVSKLSVDRCPLPAVALTVDTSVITAIGNDYGFNSLFERQIKALCTPKDVVVGISTSGRSNNVIAGFEAASEIGAYRIGFSGEDGFHVIDMDHNFKVKSNVTARIQEAHILLGHLLCLVAEKDFV